MNLTTCWWLDFEAAILEFPKKPLNATTPTAANTPMIATTTKSSINEKPFKINLLKFLNNYLRYFVFLLIY